MLTAAIIYGIISLVSIVTLLVLMFTAPNGWEDEKGFHVGKKNLT